MKNLEKLLLILCSFNLSMAFAIDDACIDYKAASNSQKPSHFEKLKAQHLVVHHSSVSKANADEYLSGHLELYNELCKTPYHHRDSLRQHGIEIHLTGGRIDQHPHIEKIMAKGLKPRNHDEHNVTFGDLPGVGSDGNDSPVILDLITLSMPREDQAHGSESLVLHEFGHAVDFFFIRTTRERKHVSDTRAFRSVSKQFDWKIFIPDFELISKDNFTFNGIDWMSKDGAYYTKESMEKWQTDIDKINEQTIESNSSREELRQYHAKNYEEAFAEIYARWYTNSEKRDEIIQRSPIAAKYFNDLDTQSYEYNLREERVSQEPRIRRSRTIENDVQITQEKEENIIKHQTCELGWMNAKSRDLYSDENGKMSFQNRNTEALLQLLREKGYLPKTNKNINKQAILFSVIIQLKGEKPEGTFDEILTTGMSFLSPSNKIMISVSNGLNKNSRVLYESEKSFRRKSLATNADYIYDLINKELPECRKL